MTETGGQVRPPVVTGRVARLNAERRMKVKLQRLVGRTMPPVVGNVVAPMAFPVTHRFLHGRMAAAADAQPNIVHLTLNKAASQNTAKILSRLLAERGYRTVWPNRYSFFTTMRYFNDLDAAFVDANPNILAPRNIFVAAIARPLRHTAVIAGTQQILAVRDPRDILISDYYSRLYFHPEPIADDKTSTFRERRQRAADLSIDDYALGEAERVRLVFDAYVEVARRPTCLGVLRFEDFIGDFPGWLNEAERICGLPKSPHPARRLGPLVPQQPSTERHDVKLRAGRSGQFRERLRPETIAELDRIFASALTHFGYA